MSPAESIAHRAAAATAAASVLIDNTIGFDLHRSDDLDVLLTLAEFIAVEPDPGPIYGSPKEGRG